MHEGTTLDTGSSNCGDPRPAPLVQARLPLAGCVGPHPPEPLGERHCRPEVRCAQQVQRRRRIVHPTGGVEPRTDAEADSARC